MPIHTCTGTYPSWILLLHYFALILLFQCTYAKSNTHALSASLDGVERIRNRQSGAHHGSLVGATISHSTPYPSAHLLLTVFMMTEVRHKRVEIRAVAKRTESVAVVACVMTEAHVFRQHRWISKPWVALITLVAMLRSLQNERVRCHQQMKRYEVTV